MGEDSVASCFWVTFYYSSVNSENCLKNIVFLLTVKMIYHLFQVLYCCKKKLLLFSQSAPQALRQLQLLCVSLQTMHPFRYQKKNNGCWSLSQILMNGKWTCFESSIHSFILLLIKRANTPHTPRL